MRTIVHLSDLHFGRTRPDLLNPLLAAVHAATPDLVVVSGDLTQRARWHQFREARAFLDRIMPPCLVIPGNHDVPLDNVVLRLLGPWHRYRRWIGTNLEPDFQDVELVVVGVNTVNPLEWQRGRISRGEVARICSAFRARDDGRTRIVVAHHPFAHLPQERKALMRGAKRAITALASCGADIVLCGHLHAWRAEPLGPGGESRAVLLVQAGTGLSTRVRGEDNDFNLLRVQPGEVIVERFVAKREQSEFSSVGRARFVRGSGGWQAAGGPALTPNVVTVGRGEEEWGP